MSAVTPLRFSEARHGSISSGSDRTRLGVVVPLCVVVAVAIVCIIVAALTSANRADEVALAHDKQLLIRAVVNNGEWSLRRLKTVTESNDVPPGAEESEPATQARIASTLNTLVDLDLVAVLNSANRVVRSQIGGDDTEPLTLATALPQIQAIGSHVRGNAPLPPNTFYLTGSSGSTRNGGMPEGSAYLQTMMGRLVVVAAALVGPRAKNPPIVLTVRFVEDTLLANIGERLQLSNLRLIGFGTAPPNDQVFDLADRRGEIVARFAWTPRRPGAEILHSVIPFIGIAFAGFALLAGLVLRYMRRTTETIAAGENRLRYLALHDPLCGLPNRNFFSERLEAVIAEIKSGGDPAAVFYIDLDHFKDVNDTLGHPVGDELIRNVTLRLSRIMREHDLVARLGGDEFAVISSSSTEDLALDSVADRIISTVCAPYAINGHTIVIGASIGIAVIDERTGDAADIMRYADMALYRAKNEGRNRACIYDAAMDADLSNRKLVEQDLREAIENDRLSVLYQPIVNASGETVVGVEALARWNHPTRGMISPAEFIPIAEHSGLILDLGARVLRQACLDGKAWPGISVSVNVSPLQFRQVDFVNVVERILTETGFDPSRLELELTESTLLGNVENAEAAMRRLKALGVRLALDDFGTGYSSLLYLRRFPFDKLKIDRGFVLSIEKAVDTAAIVHAVVGLGRGLGMKVTAEGVETAEQHLFLRAAGVHYMQGFRFGIPSPATEIANRVAHPGTYRSIEGDAAAALAS